MISTNKSTGLEKDASAQILDEVPQLSSAEGPIGGGASEIDESLESYRLTETISICWERAAMMSWRFSLMMTVGSKSVIPNKIY